jgi:N-acetylglucosamine-6-phosphate deacetylase
MNNNKHTQGPWIVQHRNGTFLKTIVTESKENFQSIGDCTEQNAQLIAAAPEMLELLLEIRHEALTNGDSCDHELLTKLNNMIKKATGK